MRCKPPLPGRPGRKHADQTVCASAMFVWATLQQDNAGISLVTEASVYATSGRDSLSGACTMLTLQRNPSALPGTRTVLSYQRMLRTQSTGRWADARRHCGCDGKRVSSTAITVKNGRYCKYFLHRTGYRLCGFV